MPGFDPLIGRRNFLATSVLGTVGALLPASSADASAPPPAAIGAARAAVPTGDTSIRPFKYRATDAELADLKRRIKATKWPDRETVDDDTRSEEHTSEL